MACNTFSCKKGQSTEKHNESLVIYVLWKFISPLLKNNGQITTDLAVEKDILEQNVNKAAKRKYRTFQK